MAFNANAIVDSSCQEWRKKCQRSEHGDISRLYDKPRPDTDRDYLGVCGDESKLVIK